MYGNNCTKPCLFAFLSMTRWIRAQLGWMTPLCKAAGEVGNRSESANRGKQCSKRHLVFDARGISLVVLISASNSNRLMLFKYCADAIPVVNGLQGYFHKIPYKLYAYKGYE